ncbi:unnamed protein product [Lymnaea stagnalis]|uniref:beta-N-acetylhexosaminidase n=1 Tax=Lymnaea stagnalis TaxID=6523 RepID=A0AAV2HF26_LYMST
MGRRGNMRGRSGILFVSVFAVGLVIFYLSWRSLFSTDIKPKDAYSKFSNGNENIRSELRNKLLKSKEFLNGNSEQDPDYEFKSDQDQIPQNKLLKIPENSVSNSRIRKIDGQDETNESIKRKIYGTSDSKNHQLEKAYYKSFDKAKLAVRTMEKLVHLDLKGAPPKMTYLKKLLPLFASLGATGLLVEYEDMFPYYGILKNISAENSYRRSEIKEFLKLAKTYNLTVMPLIQTFGHMEFVLKSAFEDLRESHYTPQVIDITSNKSYAVITEIVKQILELHPDASHLHIGCDEVYELGRGASASQKKDNHELFLHHVTKVANIVRYTGNQQVKPVIWDDELRKISANTILEFKLPSLVEIMVWQYGVNVLDKINITIWDKYSGLFESVWIASAFKGASGSRQFFTDPQFHIQNHFSWLEVIASTSNRLKFRGIALTGWSRYDHFATLCELLPVALPSLAVCLAAVSNAGFTEAIHKSTSQLLDCKNLIEMTYPSIDNRTKMALVSQDCRFPGHAVYHAMQSFYGYTQVDLKHRTDGWLSDYQVNHGFSNPGQLKVFSMIMNKVSSGYAKISYPLKENLEEIYSEDTVEEWMEEQIEERRRHIEEAQLKVKKLLENTVWGRRPLLSSKFNRDGSVNGGSIMDNRAYIKKRERYEAQHIPSNLSRKEININSQNLNGERFVNGWPSRVKGNSPDQQLGITSQKDVTPDSEAQKSSSNKTNLNQIKDHEKDNPDPTESSYANKKTKMNTGKTGSKDNAEILFKNVTSFDIKRPQEKSKYANAEEDDTDLGPNKNDLSDIEDKLRRSKYLNGETENIHRQGKMSKKEVSEPMENILPRNSRNSNSKLVKKLGLEDFKAVQDQPSKAEPKPDLNHSGDPFKSNQQNKALDNNKIHFDDEEMNEYEKKLLEDLPENN